MYAIRSYYAVSVMARTETYMSDIEVDDTAAAIIRFESGALGIVEATTATRNNFV